MSVSEEKAKKKKSVFESQTKLLVFGSNKHHQLIVENNVVDNPESIKIETNCIVDAAGGLSHSVLCACDGSLICAGDNSKFQFGKIETKSKFEKIKGLKNDPYLTVCCGAYFSAAITEHGNLYTWGSNEYGELGRKTTENYGGISLIKSLSTYKVVQVTCGFSHCLVLTLDSVMLAWGRNNYGQLGIDDEANPIEFAKSPQILHGLTSLPIASISAGHFFSICVSVSGSVFTWGSNHFCQLGTGLSSSEQAKSKIPVYLKSIKDIRVVKAVCGSNHTALLTRNGGVFTFGCGSQGQLGLGDLDNQSSPRQVPDLMGSTVTQIACGDNFTLAYVYDYKKVFGFGISNQGQLGFAASSNFVNTPKSFKITDHIKAKKQTDTQNQKNNNKYEQLRKICCGANHSLILLTDEKHIEPEDYRKVHMHEYNNIATVTVDMSIRYTKNKIKFTDAFKSNVFTIFGSLACLAGSFLDTSDKNDHFKKSKFNCGIDIDNAYSFQLKFFKSISKDEVCMLRVHIYENMLSHHTNYHNYPAIECLRAFLILLVSPLHESIESYDHISVPLYQCINSLASVPHTIFESWLTLIKPRYFKKIVESIAGLVKHHVANLPPGRKNIIEKKAESQMTTCLDFMKILYVINERSKIISFSSFYVCNIYEQVDIERNFIEWATANTTFQAAPFSFCTYPFIFDGKSKTRLLQVEASLFMRNAVLETHTNLLMSILNAATNNPESVMDNPQMIQMENPFFVIGVNRDTILEDTLKQLQAASQKDFKKPLKISFSNEEAVDDGGVVKEYFLLVIREIMLPKRGLFKCYKESNMCYFQQSVKNKDTIYRCVGQLCGLAIYNGVIVDLHFPLALFKKLLGETLDIDDLIELDPILGNSLQQLLNYSKSDFTEVFDLVHEITWEDANGKLHQTEQFSKGKSTSVTLETKEQYVIDYIQFILTDNVESSFNSFKIGFYLVAVGSVIKLFRPIELQEMTVGLEISDWDEIQKNARYEGEYWAGHQVIKWFWEVFREFKQNDKRKFLRFLTGCDRAPITGISDFKIVIQPTSGGDKFYPVAHTCYNLLDLPKYSSKAIVKSRLTVSLDHTEGFTLV